MYSIVVIVNQDVVRGSGSAQNSMQVLGGLSDDKYELHHKQKNTQDVRVRVKVPIDDQSMDSSNSTPLSPIPPKEAPTRGHNHPSQQLGHSPVEPIQTQYYSTQHQPPRQNGPQESHFPTNQTQATDNQAVNVSQANFVYDSYTGTGIPGHHQAGAAQHQGPPNRTSQTLHNQAGTHGNNQIGGPSHPGQGAAMGLKLDQDDNDLLFGTSHGDGGFQTNPSRQAHPQAQPNPQHGGQTAKMLGMPAQGHDARGSNMSSPAKPTPGQSEFQFEHSSPQVGARNKQNIGGFDEFENRLASNVKANSEVQQKQAMPPAEPNNSDPFGGFNFNFGGEGDQSKPKNTNFGNGDFFGEGGNQTRAPEVFEFKPRQQGQKKAMDVQFNDFFGENSKKQSNQGQQMEFNFSSQQNKPQNQPQQSNNMHNSLGGDFGNSVGHANSQQGKPLLN